MADKVKPLKIENTATGGGQIDPFPVETNPAQDYLASKGIAFENNDNRTIDLDGSGNIQFKDVTETVAVTVRQLRTALNIWPIIHKWLMQIVLNLQLNIHKGHSIRFKCP